MYRLLCNDSVREMVHIVRLAEAICVLSPVDRRGIEFSNPDENETDWILRIVLRRRVLYRSK